MFARALAPLAPIARPPARATTRVERARARGAITRRATDADGADAANEPGAEPSAAMLEFGEAGFPSDEDDVLDPRARDRAMNKVVDEIHELNAAETEVLNKAFELVEKFGLKRKGAGSDATE
jgi:hypothetical protein